jgi:monoamine oxidase
LKSDRRNFLKLVTASAGAVTLGDEIAEAMDRSLIIPDRTADVAIVGAGLAGLTTARELEKNGVTVCVLDARDRVGGRTLDHPIGGGHVVEGGGQWVGPGQTRVLALARELGVATFPSYTEGKLVVSFSGLRVTRPGNEEDSADVRRIKVLLENLAKTVPALAPWTAPRAREWDDQTVADWLSRNTHDAETKQIFEISISTELGDMAKISLLYYLFYIRAAGGIRALEVYAQETRFVGGPQSLSIRIAQALADRLVLGSPVVRIVDDEKSGVRVESKKLTVSARRAVVAMMPADTRRITFTPELPLARQGLVKAWRGQTAIKVNVVYERPFWREDGLSGLGLTDRPPIGVTFDNSPPDGKRGVLLAFLTDNAVAKDPSARRNAVLAGLATLFGKRASTPVAYFETDWSSDGWTTGCVSPAPRLLLTRFGSALRAPVGRIHWAGTETSDAWCGYMDGAVRSGERVAAEVLAALRAERGENVP